MRCGIMSQDQNPKREAKVFLVKVQPVETLVYCRCQNYGIISKDRRGKGVEILCLTDAVCVYVNVC